MACECCDVLPYSCGHWSVGVPVSTDAERHAALFLAAHCACAVGPVATRGQYSVRCESLSFAAPFKIAVQASTQCLLILSLSAHPAMQPCRARGCQRPSRLCKSCFHAALTVCQGIHSVLRLVSNCGLMFFAVRWCIVMTDIPSACLSSHLYRLLHLACSCAAGTVLFLRTALLATEPAVFAPMNGLGLLARVQLIRSKCTRCIADMLPCACAV